MEVIMDHIGTLMSFITPVILVVLAYAKLDGRLKMVEKTVEDKKAICNQKLDVDDHDKLCEITNLKFKSHVTEEVTQIRDDLQKMFDDIKKTMVTANGT